MAYKIGTMIEVPRAALVADQIAQYADFFSFGTNDLTQMTFGYSRDDAPKFLKYYKELGIIKTDPFEVLDQEGVGQLVAMGTKKRPCDKARLESRNMRRAWRRAVVCQILRKTRHELRFMFAVPCADSTCGGGASCNRELRYIRNKNLTQTPLNTYKSHTKTF